MYNFLSSKNGENFWTLLHKPPERYKFWLRFQIQACHLWIFPTVYEDIVKCSRKATLDSHLRLPRLHFRDTVMHFLSWRMYKFSVTSTSESSAESALLPQTTGNRPLAVLSTLHSLAWCVLISPSPISLFILGQDCSASHNCFPNVIG